MSGREWAWQSARVKQEPWLYFECLVCVCVCVCVCACACVHVRVCICVCLMLCVWTVGVTL